MQKKQPDLRRKRLANTPLSETELSVILGGILGDGSLKLYPNYKNARYTIRHSIKQKSYFYVKCNLLQNLSSEKSISRQSGKGRWSSLDKMHFQSRALPSLTAVHSVTHVKNKLVCKRKWLNHLTAQSLAIWWFDDGSIIGNGRKGVFCTHGFTRKECEIIKRYLFVSWGIEVTIGKAKKKDSSGKTINNGLGCFEKAVPKKGIRSLKRNKNQRSVQGHSFVAAKQPVYYCLYISTLPLQKLLKNIIPYIPCAEMIYKCFLRYKSQNLQQRWISQLADNCPVHLRDDCIEYAKKLRK